MLNFKILNKITNGDYKEIELEDGRLFKLTNTQIAIIDANPQNKYRISKTHVKNLKEGSKIKSMTIES